jgi:hypothetical protein
VAKWLSWRRDENAQAGANGRAKEGGLGLRDSVQ